MCNYTHGLGPRFFCRPYWTAFTFSHIETPICAGMKPGSWLEHYCSTFPGGCSIIESESQQAPRVFLHYWFEFYFPGKIEQFLILEGGKIMYFKILLKHNMSMASKLNIKIWFVLL